MFLTVQTIIINGAKCYGTKCPWGKMSCGETFWGELSMGRVVHGASCLWSELSMGRAVHGASCLWGEFTVGRVVMGRVVHGPSFDGASCPGIIGTTKFRASFLMSLQVDYSY
jgi:hypothetical protein